jgi:DNA-binding response OmpR family regulator
MRAHILLAEDEERSRIALSERLCEEGCTVESVMHGDEAFQKITTQAFDMLILNFRMQDCNCLNLCRDIRARGVKIPILLLTGRCAVEQKIMALKLGADAYLAKPFDPAELLALTEALLRRISIADRLVHHFGSICVNLSTRSVTRDDVAIRLSGREFRLLSYFVRHPGVLLPREQILKDVWDDGVDASTRTLDVHVASLRQKLEVDAKRPKLICTVRKRGYRFEAGKFAAVI